VSGSPALVTDEQPAWTERVAARLPWWAALLLIYAASRVVTTLLFLAVGAGASPASRVGAHPSLLSMLTAWDGQWYWLIGVGGYPSALPHTAGGDIDTNQWAFLPVYPLLVQLLAVLSGLPWPPVAVVVSVAAGGGAAVLLGLLLRPHLGAPRAAFAVAVFCCSPLAFVLQTAYAESLGLCLLFAALILVDRHRYLAAVPVAVVLAFTRPGVLALALAVALQLVLRLLRARRGGPAVPTGELVGGLVLAGVATVAGFAWSAIAGIVTGVPDAYFQTELAWRALWMGRGEFAFFTPWFFAGDFWFGRTLQWGPFAGPVAVVLVVAGFAALLFTPAVRRIGETSRLWLASYALYLFAVFFPQSSVFRLLMPMAPLAGAAVPRSRTARAAVLIGCLALQALWLWCVDGQPQVYWSVP
jgi:hypothetical protein